MRVYLAAPWARKDTARYYGNLLEETGHVITHKWWDIAYDGEYPAHSAQDRLVLKEHAYADLKGVRDAHVVVVLNLERSEGKAFEAGYAYAMGIPVLFVGEELNIFQYAKGYTSSAIVGLNATPRMQGVENFYGALRILNAMEFI